MGLKMSRETFVNFLYQTGNMDMVDNWFVRTWWLMKIRHQERLRKKLVSLERQFLLQDLQFISRWQTRFTRLRYLDEDGILYSAMFKIRWEGQSCKLTQYPGGPPIAVSKPKGPMKFRKLECVSSKRRWFGISRLLTWEVGYYSSL